MQPQSNFLPVLILMAIAAAVATVLPILNALGGRRRPHAVKDESYECGVGEMDSVHKRHSIRFYLTALTFIVFDVEVAFLYPWAVLMKRVPEHVAKVYLFGSMLLFLGVILLAYAWEWKRGALEWE